MKQVLNPGLFNRLRAAFGLVSVTHAGEQSNPAPDAQAPLRGERYGVNCPLCGDQRQRLSVHYQWGAIRPDGSRALAAVKCFNEECFKRDHEAKRQLWQRVVSQAPLPCAVARPADRPSQPRQDPMRYSLDLRELAADHPAAVYLADRGFDPRTLSLFYGVRYATGSQANAPDARDRLAIPVFLDGVCRGHQFREVAGVAYPPRFGGRRPKYYTQEGLRVGSLLYNIDAASLYDLVVVVEGVTDVWSFGPSAVCAFGAGVSDDQARLLASRCPGARVLLLQDGNAAGTGQQARKCEALSGRFRRGVRVVTMPEGADPGSFRPRSRLHAFVASALADQGDPVTDFFQKGGP